MLKNNPKDSLPCILTPQNRQQVETQEQIASRASEVRTSESLTN